MYDAWHLRYTAFKKENGCVIHKEIRFRALQKKKKSPPINHLRGKKSGPYLPNSLTKKYLAGKFFNGRKFSKQRKRFCKYHASWASASCEAAMELLDVITSRTHSIAVFVQSSNVGSTMTEWLLLARRNVGAHVSVYNTDLCFCTSKMNSTVC